MNEKCNNSNQRKKILKCIKEHLVLSQTKNYINYKIK